MSGHMRFGLAAFLLVAGFSTPAAANVITDLFSPSPAPAPSTTAATPAQPGQDDCLSRPGESTAGQHWVYRYDGHRKCWFQAAADSALARRAARHHVARRSVAAPDESEPAPRRRKAVEDAHDEMVSSAPAQTPQVAPSAPAPAETPQVPSAAPSEPKLTIVHTIPIRLADAAAQVPPAPVPVTSGVDQPSPNQPTSDRPTSAQSAPPQVDVDKLLAEAPAASAEVASAPAATPVAAPAAKTAGGGEWTPSWLGALLIALGGVALLSASLRGILWPARLPGSRTEHPVVAHDGRTDPSFTSERIPSASASRDELLRYDPQSVAPLAHAARTRRPEAPELPAQEAFWEDEIGALAALANPASPEDYSGRRAMGYRRVG
jgi:hypothetical protein